MRHSRGSWSGRTVPASHTNVGVMAAVVSAPGSPTCSRRLASSMFTLLPTTANQTEVARAWKIAWKETRLKKSHNKCLMSLPTTQEITKHKERLTRSSGSTSCSKSSCHPKFTPSTGLATCLPWHGYENSIRDSWKSDHIPVFNVTSSSRTYAATIGQYFLWYSDTFEHW